MRQMVASGGKELNCDTKYIYQILPNYLYLLTYTSWQSKMFNLQQKLNFTSSDISHKDLRSKLNKTFVDMIFEQQNKISSSNSEKLQFDSKISNLNRYKLNHYLRFSLKEH